MGKAEALEKGVYRGNAVLIETYSSVTMMYLSYLRHFKTRTSRLYEKKDAVYYFQISLLVPEILYKQAKS